MFDVVSVKENREATLSPITSKPFSPMALTPRSLSLLSVTTLDLIRWGYELERHGVAGGPDWIDTVRFDVRGTTTSETRIPEFREMVRGMLRTRFQMDAIFETEERPIYRLVLAHPDGHLGPMIAAAPCKRDNDAISARNEAPTRRPDCAVAISSDGQAVRTIIGTSVSVSELARALSGSREIDRPVLDFTGLRGEYTFIAQVSGDNTHNPISVTSTASVAASTDLFSALREQLGLRLERGRGPVRVLRIRQIERPTAD
jgi:uncharacterized protein (TIGR03435 family)